ncbi:MAG: aminotransferase class V-fold PLP-dependent enzyme [Leptolyngbyaceae bacterium]|nr:aminotransferase class V-fold PLP-dependent enzyme [Leptolyngbyaceae bacterium]
MILSPSESDRLIQQRQQFPALQTKAYFNYGGQGPLPLGAIAAITEAHQRLQSVGPFSFASYVLTSKETELTREAIAQTLHVSPKTLTFTDNVLTGCNIVLWGLPWKSGDHILLSDCEYPAVIATVQELQRRFGIEYSFCPLMETLNQGDPVAAMQAHLKPNTRLVILSHVLWNIGKVLPMADMVQVCHDAKARVLVDAAQSVGVLPLNLTALNADFYAFTGHKWWCGPAGLGALYINPVAYDALRPTFIGWRGVIKDGQGQPVGFHDDGQRFEVSTYDFTSLIALREAIALHQQWGTDTERFQRILDLSAYLWQQLATIPHLHRFCTAPPECGLVFFRIDSPHPKIHGAVVQGLEKQGFLLRTILDPDCIRACVNYLTLETEIDALVTALQVLIPEMVGAD